MLRYKADNIWNKLQKYNCCFGYGKCVYILFQMSHFSLSESKLGSIPYVEKFYKKHFEHRCILGKMCIKI